MTEARRKTRGWAIPPEPDAALTQVWDRRGQLWVRPIPAKRWYQADPQTRRAFPGRGLPWVELLITHGPLTDRPLTRPTDTQGDAR